MKNTTCVTLLVLSMTLTLSWTTKDTSITHLPDTVDTTYIAHDDFIPRLIGNQQNVTTFIFVRHGEKEDNSADPTLNARGIARADELMRVLKKVTIDAVYSSPFKRTRNTVMPTAIHHGKPVTDYSVHTSYQELVQTIRADHDQKIVLIAGHSNTIPGLIKVLTDDKIDLKITENQYDNLLIVFVPTSGDILVKQLKYGNSTP